jgi:GDPmannose 4,6-dehydratase
MSKKRALITGITGQDGSYLAEFLLEQGYEVHGFIRRVAHEDPLQRLGRVAHLKDRVTFHPGSLESFASVYRVFAENEFDECYHLAAQSFVTESFEDSFSTMDINVSGTHFVLEALRQLRPECRFYFAGSSEMFGKAVETPQSETTRFHPRSPYGVSKVTGFYLTMNFRESYELFCCSGILFNHESPRRGLDFVTRKITSTVARIKLGLADKLYLGNLDARRDWGYAAEYVEAMHLMLQQDEPDDFVVGTGETHSVREFCEVAFSEVDLDYKDWVEVDPNFYRPAEVELLIGDPAKAKKKLGWEAQTSFAGLVRKMVASDMEQLSAQAGHEPGKTAPR